MHDAFVGWGQRSGMPDALINIPSMPFLYVAAFVRETLATVLGIFGIHWVDHRKSHDGEPAQAPQQEESAPSPPAAGTTCGSGA